MKKVSWLLVLCMMLSMLSGVALAEGMTAGTYTATVKGMFEGLTVEVVVSDAAIEQVAVTAHNETDTGFPALEKIPQAIVDAQSVAVDSIAGATMTSVGIVEAVKQALTEAGADLEAFSTPVENGAADLSYYPVMGSFEVPATWDESYDVVVVGSGFAGLSAAYASTVAGADTVLIEKLSTTGGNSATNGGQYAAYTSDAAADLQTKFDLVPDTAEKHIEDTIVGGDRMSDIDLVTNMVYGSPYVLNLLLENGLQIRDTLARPGGHYGYRTYVTENQVGADITSVQYQMVEKAGTKVQLETKMVEIYRTRDEGNRVVGIRVATADGYKTIEAKKGVILCTGGFGGNVEMRQTQVPYLTADIPTTNIAAVSSGEGIYLAQSIGANTMQMSNIQRYPFANPENGVLDRFAVWPFTGPSYGVVYVDYMGNRYVNEGERRDVCADAASNSGFVSTYALCTDAQLTFAKPEEIADGIATGRLIAGDTLEELAENMNAFAIKGQFPTVTAENLKNSVDRHNSFIDSGVDEDFGKVMASTMVKIEAGPYYAIPQYPSVHHTMGGLVITPHTEVKDIYGQIITGLYAAGEVTGGVHGTNRLGSNADADCCATGFISGTYVATGEMPEFAPVK